MATVDSLSASKARVEDLKGVIEDQKAKKDEYASIISQQSSGTFLVLCPLAWLFANICMCYQMIPKIAIRERKIFLFIYIYIFYKNYF